MHIEVVWIQEVEESPANDDDCDSVSGEGGPDGDELRVCVVNRADVAVNDAPRSQEIDRLRPHAGERHQLGSRQSQAEAPRKITHRLLAKTIGWNPEVRCD
jgi:hypothetical protein